MAQEDGAGRTTVQTPADFMKNFQSSINTTSANSEPTVYLGGMTGDHEAQAPGGWQRKELPLTQAVGAFYQWSDEERQQWGKRLYGAGVIKDPHDFDSMLQAWEYAVKQTASFNAAGKKNLTPWAFMDMLEQQGTYKGALEDRLKATQPQTRTSQQTQYNIPSKSDAQAAIRTLFKEQLGRDPEDGELDRYTSMLISKFKANPASTTTTTTVDPNGNSTSKSTSKSGFNPAGYLEDQAQGDPEWGAYQAATQYMNALQGAIGAVA